MSKLSRSPALALFSLLCLQVGFAAAAWPDEAIDFNRQIRPILSNKCFRCHGPDPDERKADLRLDTREGAVEDRGGYAAVAPGKPDESELLRRVKSDDEYERMPPTDAGKPLSPAEIELLTRWIEQDAPYAKHWSYVAPTRPALPTVQNEAWPKNPIDRFILARLEREGLTPSPEADRYALIRRVSLDLTGLPPSWEEVQRFVHDESADAYEKLVDRLLREPAYGEHWARKWLDLARYADSAGYADDPPRTIWAYRDYVIRSINANKPFDQFTIEQIAGDLLPDPTQEQLVATAFHRNTLTNNEGGTIDEEFRNVAVVDRVNTTMSVWMGTTMACAQCHTHKYDPITQEEYFRLFAIFNSTADADRRDESPLVEIWTDQQERQKARWQAEIARLEKTVVTVTPELLAAQAAWEKQFQREPTWSALPPSKVELKSGGKATVADDGSVLVPAPHKTDVYTVELPLDLGGGEGEKGRGGESNTALTAIRLEALPHDSLPSRGPGHGGGNFVVSRVRASLVPPADSRTAGRYLRVEIPGKQKILSLAEVQIFRDGENLALQGEAKQSSTDYDGLAQLAIDGETDGDFFKKHSTTHTAQSDDPWWEVDLKSTRPIDRVVLWNRTDGNVGVRLKNFRVALLDEKRQIVWETTVAEPPKPSVELSPGGARSIELASAYADFAQDGFEAAYVIDNPQPNEKGWAVAPRQGQPHALTLVPESPIRIPVGAQLRLVIEQTSRFENHVLGHFRVAVTTDAGVARYAQTPPAILAILKTDPDARSDAQRAELTKHFLTIAEALAPARERLASLKKQLAALKPRTTVPVMRELDKPRVTHIQHRGNYLDTGALVEPGLPSAFPAPPEGAEIDRLTLAKWLVSDKNPLTPRVVANRYWAAIFGVGIVATSGDFGSQGELPTHPELLDWLAVELRESGWNIKHLLRLLVTSAAYRQSSRVTPELFERDPDNRLLARGPRFRLSAEMIRDQALAASGLLSDKMFGPPVKPPQPSLGLSAAFGGGIDWKTSAGEDRYRRGLYTMWRRSSPYPSMATFDAPNRQICTIRRDRTNTPLQALVTLNDPVYVEAAQALARRMVAAGGSAADKARFGFTRCLCRPPSEEELAQLTALYEDAYQQYAAEPAQAEKMATDPLGPLPPNADASELAAWTVVGNVLLNLDEMMMKR